MTEQEQRIAIAECCGWTDIIEVPYYPGVHDEPLPHGLFGTEKPEYIKQGQPVPDYLNDLNAMHEAEKCLDFNDEVKGQQYRNMLFHLIKVRPLIIHASARQRAEAFLRTVGKWKENKP